MKRELKPIIITETLLILRKLVTAKCLFCEDFGKPLAPIIPISLIWDWEQALGQSASVIRNSW